MRSRALVRRIPKSYAIYDRPDRPMELAKALAQHEQYVAALESANLRVTYVREDESLYDCVFIEDTAIVWRDRALITRMRAPREGEQKDVANELGKTHELIEPEPGVLIEGGDVLHVGDITYVGRSSRTNEAGVEQLCRFMGGFQRKVQPLLVDKCLHLKTGATYLGDGTLLVAQELIDPSLFKVKRIIETDPSEPWAANCLRIGDVLLAPKGYPKTMRKLREFASERNLTIAELDVSEFEKGDGSLTCLSVIW